MSLDSATDALSLQAATRNSTSAWQQDLAMLFRHAKERFPDVVWELTSENGGVEEVWGHKAIVYARAPPSFRLQFLLQDRTASPAPSTVGGLTRVTTSINFTVFSTELEYLYTGQSFGEALEFLFNNEEGIADDAEEFHIDKLRKDLAFMWCSRLYSDVRIALTSDAPSDDDDADDRQIPVFSSHRFILASRSPYFQTALVSSPSPSRPLSSSMSSGTDSLTLWLPSPPFTPASLHFTLNFLYTGTLVSSLRTYDLATALALLLCANYLSLPTLHAEVQARIISEMAHGLFHATLPLCLCAARVPRILEFALRSDVQDAVLERGARRALVGLFGTGWCTPEFAVLPPKLHFSTLKGLEKRTTPANALAILWAAEAARMRLAPLVDPWADTVRPLIDAGRSLVDAVFARQTADVLAEADWNAITHADSERIEWTMRSLVRGVSEVNAGHVYQALVDVLLLPHPEPTEEGSFLPQPLLSQTSHVRMQVEQARFDVLQWFKRGGSGRAVRVAQKGGLDRVEAWAIREISDFLEIPADELLAAISPPPGQYLRQSTSTSSASPKSTLLSAGGTDPDQHSLHTQQSSMRVSVLSRSIPMPCGADSVRQLKAAEKDDDSEAGEQPDLTLALELGAGLLRSPEAGQSSPLKGKGRANGNNHGSGSANNSAPPPVEDPCLPWTPPIHSSMHSPIVSSLQELPPISSNTLMVSATASEISASYLSQCRHSSNIPVQRSTDSMVIQQQLPPETSELDYMHRGPWLDIHRNFASCVTQTVRLRNGPLNELLRLSKQWAEWDVLASLANYHSVVTTLFGYLKAKDSPNSNRALAVEVFDCLSRDISSVLRQMNSILSDSAMYKLFLSSQGTLAQELLDLLQDLLDSPYELTSRPALSKVLLRLSDECRLHPTCFALSGLKKVGQQVAGGGYGDIWKGLVDGQSVAVKSMRQFLDKDVEASLKMFGREALIWRQLSHQNLLPFFGLYKLDNRLCLVSPWMNNGDLKQFLSNAQSLIDRVSLIADVAMGLEYLHSKHVVHGDLKTANVLVTPSGRACITDFGLSTIVDELSRKFALSSHSARAGTVRYQAPELLSNKCSNHFGSDVYAFACLCYENRY
ncbi:hypothetical protein MVEN_00497100 [Mycena venus]|uniref:Protein kinase domain-containing protein n=1 Tax=Mycena venus TaxID=2733690 RepID=A0A8H6YYL5_9AGAR|nr:hypothetical protein MVEN_00497100 [Mycena venus]